MSKMFKQVKIENLNSYLSRIEKLFPEFLHSHEAGIHDVEKYYAQSFWGYALFHSWAGAIHMALSPSGKFSKHDYFRQAEEIEILIEERVEEEKQYILEIGCGRGFNLKYLSQCFQEDSFIGIDVSERNVQSAKEMLETSNNTIVEIDDFHTLSKIENASMNLVFAVETLCHAHDMQSSLSAVARTLKDSGQLIVYDGFRFLSNGQSKQMLKAIQYTEKAMAVPKFWTEEDFISVAKICGLHCVSIEDRSEEIMPNLIRLSDISKAFFKIPVISKIILSILPRGLVTNAVAGLLMAVTVQSGDHRYKKMIFKKLRAGI